MEPQDQLYYQAYLLRLWQERPAAAGRPAVWRCSLEDPHSGRRRAFNSPEALADFLRAQVEAVEGAAEERR